jgi:PAP2 superfamily protein
MPDGRRWGQDATPTPGWDRVLWAAERAALDPGTWIPAAAAVAVRPFDGKLSRWARDRAPVYGSRDSASDASRELHQGLRLATVATTLATPGGTNAVDWATSKAEGLAVEWSAWEATSLATSGIKRAADRTRPSRSDRSFPSSCASDSFTDATLTSRNLDAIAMPTGLRTGLQVGVYASASAAAWARAETGSHYPSDILAGAVLGRFLGSFVHDAFLGLPRDDELRLEIAPSRDGVEVALSIDF